MATKIPVKQKPAIDPYSVELAAQPKAAKTSGAVNGPGSENSKILLQYAKHSTPGAVKGAQLEYAKKQLAAGGYAASPTLEKKVQDTIARQGTAMPAAPPKVDQFAGKNMLTVGRPMQPVNLGKQTTPVPGPLQVQQLSPGARPPAPAMPMPMPRGNPPNGEMRPGMYQPPIPPAAMQNANWIGSPQYQGLQNALDNRPRPGMPPMPAPNLSSLQTYTGRPTGGPGPLPPMPQLPSGRQLPNEVGYLPGQRPAPIGNDNQFPRR